MQEEKFYTCKYDRAFKEVMLKEGNEIILKSLLESILKIEINNIKVENNERNTGNLKVKRKHLDAILDTNIGKVEIEVNSTMSKYVRPRNMAYLCDIYSHEMLVGEEYNEDIMFIQINLSYGIKDKKLNRCYKVVDEEGKNYVKNFIIYEFNMERYKEFWYNKDKEKIEDNKYLVMLDLEKEDLLKLSKNNKVVSKYMETLENINKDYKFREYMSAEEDARKIENSIKKEQYDDGILYGIEQGSLNRSIEIAKELLKNGVDIDIISKSTGLSIEEINTLGNNE